MGKKSRRKKQIEEPIKNALPSEFSSESEKKFKNILRIMSWIVGICFLLIIILPNFEFFLLDEIVKIIFYIGVLNLLLFAFMEFFGNGIKKILMKL
jgi:uncharacterized membrane protein